MCQTTGEQGPEEGFETVIDTEMVEKKDEEVIETTAEEEESAEKSTLCQRLVDFYWANEFLILVGLSIALAKAYPPLGATYLVPEITANWIAVCLIFFMAGLSLKTEEFSKAFLRLRFNLLIQVFNFGVVSVVVYGLSRALEASNALESSLADGMVVCASLPMTINVIMVLTQLSGGDEASAIFNSAFGNLIGVFLSPMLILGYLGVTGDIGVVEVFYKLALRAVLPVIVGQVLQKTSTQVVNFAEKHKYLFKQTQQYALVFIVYTVFCETFLGDAQSDIGDIFLMIFFQFITLVALMVAAWYMLKVLYRDEPALRVMGLYGCTHKTVAMGVPLIHAIYEDDPNIGSYTLPLLIWHPMQLVIGTFLAPRLYAFVESEKKRLGIVDEEEEDKVNEQGTQEANDEETPADVSIDSNDVSESGEL